MVYHIIRCSPTKHNITYIALSVIDLVIKELYQNNPDNDFVFAYYADDIAHVATSIEKTTRMYEKMEWVFP